ncbi:VWA domain-containing protein [Methylocaldum sp. RMAD-M]|uniref:vWA domain-containing protein n=1 Tax=Methylocaldum sp. RMAD-M TaxID=2806557 RepID=UPI000A321EED|nr:VWA domain-containing protein [Methylocaldum sp. RMAD-M]MBP1151608.1 Ca-activated chloride channel family protein [Methylocaldum sp. RMAD-M]
MNEFHFLRPWWLLAVLPLAAILWGLYRRRRSTGDWKGICDDALLPHVLIGGDGRASRHPLFAAALGGIVAIMALAGPVWERLPAPAFRNIAAVVIVLDLSSAMEAVDLKPTRLERARYKIADILKTRKDGQTALVVYAGDAFTVTPLTDDAATIAAQLFALNSGLMPVQGTRIDLALESAARLLRQAGLRSGDILLVTAGERAAEAEEAAHRLKTEGYRISVLGVGTEEGAPVPMPEGGFLKDDTGNIVVPRLDTDALRKLARAGGGIYRNLTATAGDLDALLGFFEQHAAADTQNEKTLNVDQWKEPGVWLLLALLPLAALSFRRGWLAAWLLVLAAPVPNDAQALDWHNLWQRPDQQARQAFQAENYDEAAKKFQNSEWKAAAQYKAGRYEDAAKLLEESHSATGHYNRGNALARQGRYNEAIKAYQKALELDPGHADAHYNKELVEKALEQQKKQHEEQQKSQKDSGSESESKSSQSPQGPSDGQDRKNEEEKPHEQAGKEQDAQPRDDGSNGENNSPESADAASGSESKAQDRPDKNGEKTPDDGSDPQQTAGQAQDRRPDESGEREAAAATAETGKTDETRQAEEQWLRRIPDDPGGLLKRKFYYQYRQRQRTQGAEPRP